MRQALAGKAVCTLFFEPSTRTRSSFSLAAQRLGAGAHNWSVLEAGLEEAFIYLMAGARDNFANDTPPEIAA